MEVRACHSMQEAHAMGMSYRYTVATLNGTKTPEEIEHFLLQRASNTLTKIELVSMTEFCAPSDEHTSGTEIKRTFIFRQPVEASETGQPEEPSDVFGLGKTGPRAPDL
jgi:hypothetical protein